MDLFDTRTVMLFLGITHITIISLYLSFIIFTKNSNWCLILFIIGKTFQTLGLFGLGLRGVLPEYISLTLGPVLFFIGWAFEIFAIISFDLVFRKRIFFTLLISTVIFILLALAFSNSLDYQKGVIVSIALAFYFGYGGIYFILLSDVSNFKRLIGISYAVFSVGFIIRMISVLNQGENFHFLISDDITTDIVNVLASFVISFGSIGLLFIIKEKDELTILNDNLKLKNLNSTKSKFFSIIAHDLRGPIGNLTQLGQLLHMQHNEINEDEREKLISHITHSSKISFELLENLLQWARSESGQMTVNPINFELNDIIDENLELLNQNFTKKSITIKKEYNENLSAFGDYNMISTVIRNLLSNAAKFVNESGEIFITTDHADKNNIQISISDDGVGIEPDVIDKLFDIESNYTTKGTNNEAGTGLGLKLCKEFITKNNGEISVKSVVNNGSSFCITLPISKKQKATNIV